MATAVDKHNVTIGGNFLAIKMAVNTGTNSNHGEITKRSCKAVISSSGDELPMAGCTKPIMVKITKVINIEGTVVIIMYLMCSNKGVSDDDAATTVVSDKGDILSPKNAPDTIAPAVIANDISTALATEMNATPTVATVVNELPIAVPIIAEITKTIA